MGSVVLGVASAAPQGFPRETAEVMAARAAFIKEYNRLAELAHLAPDIHIYHEDPRIQQERLANLPQQPLPQQPRPVSNPGFNAFSFSASLGTNSQFHAGPNTFPAAQTLPAHPMPQPAQDAPTTRWTGPFADTVPSGLGGRAMETEAVAAA